MSASIRSKLEKIQKAFLWAGSKIKKRLPLVAWDKVCVGKKVGGFGLRSLKDMNKSLIGKLMWNVMTKESPVWIRILREKYLRNPLEFLSKNPLPQGSEFWNNLQTYIDFLSMSTRWKIGNGHNVDFWNDC